LLDRCIFNNKVTFNLALQIFEKATLVKHTVHSQKKEVVVVAQDKEVAIQERHLTK
jgi:hypothetical protein